MYKTIDFTKFILSFFIVAIHVKGATLNDSFNLYFSKIWGIAVPVFFLISGFFIFKSYKKGGIEKIDLYIKKLIKLYILYTFIYMPITLCGFYYNENPIWKNILIFIRNVLFIGENYYSWPLWYLLALIISTIIIRILLHYKIKIHIIFLLGLLLTFMGLCIKYFINTQTYTFIDTIIYIYKTIFVTTRNGFFVGFGYVSTGFLIAYYENNVSKYTKWLYLTFIPICILYQYKIPFSLNLLSTIIFIILIFKNIYNGRNNIWLRNMSTIIYFFHMYFVFLLIIIIKLTNLQVSFTYGFIFVSITSAIFSASVLKLSTSKHFMFLKKLLG